MLPRARRSRRARPRLSVVVPVYNVEDYLAECLESLLAQTFADYEIVMVDDGSTDGSGAIAESFAKRHEHIRVVHTANGGLGAARNAGVKYAEGEFLAFADSDDTVPTYAYQLMVSTLDATGSDFVVGAVQQRVSGKVVDMPYIRRIHDQRRLKISIDDFPQIIRNVFAWDKMFRRTFWDKTGLSFPEGLRYEDQVTITEAYARATSFDVLQRPVYQWRIRDDGSSITQQRHRLADLEDRIRTKQMTTRMLDSFGSAAVRDEWSRHGLAGDLPLYFREILGCDDTYWRALHTGVRDMFEGSTPIHESTLRVGQRLVGWLVAHDRRGDAEVVLTWLETHPSGLPLQVRGDHVVAELPFLDQSDSGIPADVFRLRDHELEWDARLQSVSWSAGHLEISGFALIRGAPPASVSHTARVWLQGPGRQKLEMDVERRPTPEASQWVGRDAQDYDDGGFVARIETRELVAAATSGEGQTWVVSLDVSVDAIRRSGRLTSMTQTIELPRLATQEVAGEVRFDRGVGLSVVVRRL